MEKRLWGLFTGGQLTVIATAGLLCIAIPGGLWAAGVQFTNVSLYDPATKLRAKIVKGGAQLISDGSGALTVDGAVAATVSDGGGSLTIDGNVSETAPASLVRGTRSLGVGDPCVKLLAAPPTNGLIVKQLLVDTFIAPSTPAPGNYVAFTVGTSCAGYFLDVIPPTLGITNLPLDPGIAIPAGAALWVFVSGNVGADILGLGYLVPASAVPAATAVTEQKGPNTKMVQQLH